MKNIGLQTAQIEAINQIFASHSQIEQVILYGSRAKGNFKPGSDIDLTIVEQNLSFSDLLHIQNQLDDLLLPYKFDLSLKKNISNADLISHIERIGNIFYEK